jgi:hypothetical protein
MEDDLRALGFPCINSFCYFVDLPLPILLLIFRTQRLFSVGASCDEVVGLLTGLRAKTTKKKCASKVNKENKITSRKQLLKNQIEIYAEENACDGKKSSLNQGGYF